MRLTVPLAALLSFGLAAQDSPKAESTVPPVANPAITPAPATPVASASLMTNIEDKVEKWSDKFARFLVQQTLQ